MEELKAELLHMMQAIQYKPTPPTPEDEIIQGVCNALEVDYESLASKNRSDENVEARFIIFKLLREHTDLSLKSVGALFNRDHSTVTYGVSEFCDLFEIKDKLFMRKLEKVAEELPGMAFFNPKRYIRN
ncbi:helix-turn-helix domain-containing protein [Pedobacter sp. KBW01]|uniref:helix-turn-helix domain-containing protein n=1 Tax=Pedobacter sp. KBW01 TaxID=2153364 RepID=UPI001319D03C|nr:helix-turn-helix domain-containing protein [Pedobacter sp. KBW01]